MLQIAVSLLIAATGLLNTINANPNLSPEIRAKAETTANYAITFARTAIESETVSTINTTQVLGTNQNIVDTPEIPAIPEIPETLSVSVEPSITLTGYTAKVIGDCNCITTPEQRTYNVHFETTATTTAVIIIHSQVGPILSLNKTLTGKVFDYTFVDIWGNQLYYEVDVAGNVYKVKI